MKCLLLHLFFPTWFDRPRGAKPTVKPISTDMAAAQQIYRDQDALKAYRLKLDRARQIKHWQLNLEHARAILAWRSCPIRPHKEGLTR